MTPAEFKEKFKVGDIITLRSWRTPEKIILIGQNEFVTTRNMVDGRFIICDISENWIKVEPEKKPSEEINDKLVGLTLTFTGNIDEFNKINSAEYANKRINALQNWLDENWPKVVKK